MKKRMLVLVAVLLTAFSVSAAALELPSNDCFSPGLVRLSEAMKDGTPVSAEAELTVDSAFYARDLSLLKEMLSGMTLRYDGEPGVDRLTILRNGETLSTLSLTQTEEETALGLGDKVYPVESAQAMMSLALGEIVPDEEYGRMQKAEAFLRATPILERAPLAEVAAWLESLKEGEQLAAGFAVTQAFTLARTMSDDGTRLTRIDIKGAIGREGEAPWTVAGFLRQPAGRSPKDTFEITVTQDADNYLELSYSALRENTITRKEKAGEVSVTTALKAAGKIAGSGISSRLTVRNKNNWTADGESLSEKITVSATLTHQDKTPGRRMQRLNDVSATLKNVISITTDETSAGPIDLGDAVTLEVVMDSNTFLSGGAQLRVSVGGDAVMPAQQTAEDAQSAASAQEIQNAMREEVRSLSAKLYEQMGDSARGKLTQGL